MNILDNENEIGRILGKTINNNGCFEYQGYLDKDGYGKIKSNGSVYSVHRLIYKLYHNVELMTTEFVCHKCDNRKCCNIDHLFLGTTQDNMDDMVMKGRSLKGHKLHTGNQFRSIKIMINGIIFNSYIDAGKYYGISDNGVKKRFKGQIEIIK